MSPRFGTTERTSEEEKEKEVDTRPPSLDGESVGPAILQKDGVTKIESLCEYSPLDNAMFRG